MQPKQLPDDRGLNGVCAVPTVPDLLEQFGSTLSVRRTHGIYGYQEPTEFFWQVLSGCTRTVNRMANGRRQVGEFLWPGDMLGIGDLGTHGSDGEAVTDVSLRRYPRRTVEAQATTHTDLALWLRAMTLANLRSANRQIALLGRKTALEKIASFLLEVARHSPPAIDRFIALPMNRTDIADYLGLSNETVCRIMVQLQRTHIVTIVPTGLQLRDQAALRDLARESGTWHTLKRVGGRRDLLQQRGPSLPF